MVDSEFQFVFENVFFFSIQDTKKDFCVFFDSWFKTWLDSISYAFYIESLKKILAQYKKFEKKIINFSILVSGLGIFGYSI